MRLSSFCFMFKKKFDGHFFQGKNHITSNLAIKVLKWASGSIILKTPIDTN